MTYSLSFVGVLILKNKRKYLSKDTAKIPVQIFLWLDDFVMSAWLQSQCLFRLAIRHKSSWLPPSGEIQLVAQKYFSEDDYSDWTCFSGLPSYKADEFIRHNLPSNNPHVTQWKWKYFRDILHVWNMIFNITQW